MVILQGVSNLFPKVVRKAQEKLLRATPKVENVLSFGLSLVGSSSLSIYHGSLNYLNRSELEICGITRRGRHQSTGSSV